MYHVGWKSIYANENGWMTTKFVSAVRCGNLLIFFSKLLKSFNICLQWQLKTGISPPRNGKLLEVKTVFFSCWRKIQISYIVENKNDVKINFPLRFHSNYNRIDFVVNLLKPSPESRRRDLPQTPYAAIPHYEPGPGASWFLDVEKFLCALMVI